MNSPNKTLFVNKKKKINNRQTLALNSIDLAASQETKLSQPNSNFERITQENKLLDNNKSSAKELPKKCLTTIHLTFNQDIRVNNQVNFECLKFKTKNKKTKKEIFIENKSVQNNLVQEPEVIMVDEDKLKFKDIQIDLKNNKIDLKNAQLNEVCDDKISIISASESLNSLDESSRTFVENFFDRKLSSNSSNNQLESTKSDNEKIEEKKVDQNVQNFLENLFNYIPNKIVTKQEEFKRNGPKEFQDKVNFLENFQLENPALGKVIKNYISSYNTMTNPKASIFIKNRTLLNCCCIQNGLMCCLDALEKSPDQNLSDKCCNKCTTYEFIESSQLNDENLSHIIEASNLLNTNEFKRFYRKFRNKNSDCCCFLWNNNFSCCIDAIYESLESNNFKSLDPKFFKFYCCSKCVKPLVDTVSSKEMSQNNEDATASVRSSIDELLETSDMDKNRLDIARKSIQESFELFFKSEHVQNGDKLSIIDAKDRDSKPESIIIKPFKSETPRKPIIKSKPKFFQTQSTNKKSVTFEDPKRGFMRVEIPDWLEHLRDPVYSKSFENRQEWKN